MVEITLGTSPGTDDVSIDGVSLNDIDAFRTECLSSGDVSCGWNTLHAYLIDHDVSNFWWFLTESERRSIAEMAIKNTMYYEIEYGRSGKPNCEGGEGPLTKFWCSNNASIRYLKFAGEIKTGMDACYWQYGGQEHCFITDETYGLPCNTVICTSIDPPDAHKMCAIQVVDKTDSLDNWIIFQYNKFDIKPGGWHIPYNRHVTINTPTEFLSCASSYRETKIAEFDV